MVLMRKSWLLLAAALIAVAIVAIFLRPASKRDAGPTLSGPMGEFKPTGRPAPDIAFTAGDGSALALKDFAGKVVLLNLWATWCAPCVREMPTLDRLQAELGGPRFEVIALSSDRAGAPVVEPFYREHGLRHLRVYLDPSGEATRALGVRGLPTTLLIDAQGREIGRLEGTAEWDSGAAKALVRHHLAQPAPQ